jgi:hydrogenase maturation protein HypF
LIIENKSAFEDLKDIADYFLIHDRDIVCPADDSVVKSINAHPVKNIKQTIRRSRGYAPIPFNLDYDTPKILACGADLKNTFCILKDGKAFISQHIGETDKLESIRVYNGTIEHYKDMLSFKPEYVACDMHPQYETTKYAQSLQLPVIEVQHHHAHIASVIAENKYRKKVIGVAFDGTGFGTDGTIWGGEFLICSLSEFRRIGHFKQLPMPGGDLAAKEPWRMAGAYLQDAFDGDISSIELDCVHELDKRNWPVLWNGVSAGINRVLTSSAGRLFDAVSAILGICYINDYEGQASAEMEVLAGVDSAEIYQYEINDKESLEINFRETIKSIVRDLQDGIDKGKIAGRFHNTISEVICNVCTIIRERETINTVALGGGVFQNSLLLEGAVKKLTKAGFEVLINSAIPCNDGGISFGQAAVAIDNLQLRIDN